MNECYFDNTNLNNDEKEIESKAIEMLMLDPKNGYEYILSLKGKIREEAYGSIVRKLYVLNTRNVDKELLIKIFSNVNKKVFMTKREYDMYKELPEKVVIFRGTDDKEVVPRISWTLDPKIAFNRFVLQMHGGVGNLFVAITDKHDEIFALFDGDEREIVANVSCYKYLNYWH